MYMHVCTSSLNTRLVGMVAMFGYRDLMNTSIFLNSGIHGSIGK